MTATVHRIRAGPLPHADQRNHCRRAKDTGFHAPIDSTTEPFSFAGDPGDDMHGDGGSGPVVLITLCVLLPMAFWGVIALARHFAQQL